MAELKSEPVNPSRVRVSVGYTKNMENYESLRYDVSVESTPIRGESTEQAFERIAEFVENKLVEKLTSIENDLKGE